MAENQTRPQLTSVQKSAVVRRLVGEGLLDKVASRCMMQSAMKQSEAVVVRCERYFWESGAGVLHAGNLRR
jgi:hypothetical protein